MVSEADVVSAADVVAVGIAGSEDDGVDELVGAVEVGAGDVDAVEVGAVEVGAADDGAGDEDTAVGSVAQRKR